MASITSLSNSMMNPSIYGNRNVISGLASGMDTESMIQNAVAGIKMKITGLNQKRTKVDWQQQALRSIIDKMANFTDKYTSYASSSNLRSPAFFNNAVKATVSGANSQYVSATGKTSSDIQILGVKSLASAATYRVSGADIMGMDESGGIALEGVKWSDPITTSNMTGSLTLTNGSDKVTINLTEEDLKINGADGESKYVSSMDELATVINKKLTELEEKGENTAGISAYEANGEIAFRGVGGEINISSASGKIKDTLAIEPGKDAKTLSAPAEGKEWTTVTSKAEYLSGKEISITLDGVTKKIQLGEIDASTVTDDSLYEDLAKKVEEAFGGRVKLTNGVDGWKFSTDDGSSLSISSSVGEALGLASNNETNYANTSKKLEDILKDYAWDADGKGVLEINGAKIEVSKDSTLGSVMNAINNSNAGVSVNYSKLTNEFKFTAKESGKGGKIEMGGLAADLFKFDPDKVDKGTDAVLSIKVDGGDTMEITRSGNEFDLDGLKVSLKGEFGYAGDKLSDTAEKDAVKFSFTTDTDKIIGAVKDMVKDYNEMVTEIRKQFTTLPGQRSNGKRYEPLTEEDKAKMSESEIKAYEEKAKEGLLFADRDLSSLYSDLTSAVNMSGLGISGLSDSLGIEVAYSNGVTTLKVDEDKLKSALETDPNKVRDIFTGADGKDGLMQSLQNTLDEYGKVTGKKGSLVERAGSLRAPVTLHNNEMQDMLDDFDEQIDRWTNKMTDQVDMYTRKFSQLEQLIAQMNSQSSALGGMMGG